MNLAFPGDPLEHWKGSLFESLQTAGLLKDFAIDPLASDLEKWTSDDFDIYARLLRVWRNQVLEHSVSLRQRKSYFAELSHMGDLFIDPDVGVATGKIKKREKYVNLEEVEQLLDTKCDRVHVIYQHVRAQPVRKRVDSVLRAIGSRMAGVGWSTYESSTVAMLFLGRRRSRPTAIARHFTDLLGPHATKRIKHL